MKHSFYLVFIYLLYTIFLFPISVVVLVAFFVRKKITFVNFYQKLGFIPLKNPAKKQFIHVHLCSIGEWNTFFTFLRSLKQASSNPILVTYFNQDLSGVIKKSDLVEKYFFLPLENPISIHLLFMTYRIKYSIISEAESWPGLLFAIQLLKRKAFLVNAALFSAEFKRYRMLKFFFAPLFNSYHAIYPTSQDFLNRFLELGVAKEKLIPSGNFKFDTNYAKLTKKIPFTPTKKKLIVLSSIHFAEFKVIFNPLKSFLANEKYAFLIAPRSLLEKANWLKFLKKNQIPFKLRSDLVKIDFSEHVFLDSYGELYSFYEKASLVIMGGSFIPIGGHNILEPISKNKPVLIGPHTHHFSDIVAAFKEELFFSSATHLARDLQEALKKLPLNKKAAYQRKLRENRGHSKKVLRSILKITAN